jgi:hypothetical protein
MNLNNAVALEPSPVRVGLIANGALIALLEVKKGKALTEEGIENLHQAVELLKVITNLSRLEEGKVHELGEMAGMPLGLLWLKGPAETVGQQLHTAEIPHDHSSHFFEHLSFKLAAVIGQIERGASTKNGETGLLERFFAGLSHKMLAMANKERIKEADHDGD